MKIKRFNENKTIDGPPMKAYLVTFEPMTRVLAPDYMTEEEILQLARPKAIKNLRDEGIYDHLQKIEDDIVMPFDPSSVSDKEEQEKYYEEWKKKTSEKFDL